MTEAGLTLSKLVSKLEAGYRIKFAAVSRPAENLALDQDFVKR